MLRSINETTFTSKPIAVLEDGLYFRGICAANAKFIFLTGGVYDGAAVDKCHLYDIKKDKWLEIQPMHQARWKHSSCQLSGFIYVFCGIDGANEFNSVEKLAIKANSDQQTFKKWHMIAP